jgi:hypothetical protein
MLPAPWIPVDVMATDGQDAAAAGENVRLRVRRRPGLGPNRPELADEVLRALLPPQVDGRPALELTGNRPVTGSAWRWTRACTTVPHARHPACRKPW